MSKATIGVISWNKRGRSRVFWKDGVESTRNLFPPRQQLHCPNLSNLTILELLSSKGLQLPEEGVNCKVGLISISGLRRVAATSPQPQPQGRLLCTSSWSSFHTACGNQGKQKEPCPPNTGYQCFLWSLIVTSGYRGTDKEEGGHCCCPSPHCCKLLPLQLKWLPGEGIHFPPCFFSFSPFGSQMLKTRTCKNTCIYREN